MRHFHLVLLTAGVLLGQTGAVSAQPELAPPPRLAEKNIQVEFMTGGYKLVLSRPAAERLREAVNKFDGEKAVSDMLRGAAKESTDQKTAATLEIAAAVITREVPRFRKALDANMGEKGVIVTVYGLRRGKERPVLRAIGRAFLPPELQDQARAVMAVTHTTPLYWRIDGR